MNYLNPKQIEEYRENGFLVVKNIFSEKECSEIKKELIKEIKKGKEDLKNSSSEVNEKVNFDKLADIPRLINNGFLQDIAHRNSKFMKLVYILRMECDPLCDFCLHCYASETAMNALGA